MSDSPPTEKVSKISNQHKAFVEEYLLDWNATRAYTVIYPKATHRSATVAADRLLIRVDVKEYLAQRVEERNAQLRLDQAYVIKKLHSVLESDYVGTIQYVTKDQLDKIPPEIRLLVQGISVTKNSYRDGKTGNETESTVYKVSFMSKDKAAELLGRHTGAFLKDNEQVGAGLVKSFAAGLKDLGI